MGTYNKTKIDVPSREQLSTSGRIAVEGVAVVKAIVSCQSVESWEGLGGLANVTNERFFASVNSDVNFKMEGEEGVVYGQKYNGDSKLRYRLVIMRIHWGELVF